MSEKPGEECTGSRTCHGCLSWCSVCGTVSHVCDFPECDWHRRPEDVRRELESIRRDMALSARANWNTERTLPWSDQRSFRSWARGVAEEFRRMEREEAELEEELEAVEKAGGLLVPRREPEPEPDPRQLSLF